METRIKNIFSKTQIDFEISKGQPRSTRYDFSIRTTAPPGGWGVLNKFLYGVAPSQSPTLSLLFTIFHEKGTPFVYRLLLTNGTPFTYLV